MSGHERLVICLSLTGKTIAENLRAISRYAFCIDLVELRADFLLPTERPEVDRFPSAVPAGRDGYRLPAILTVRAPRDGGKWNEGEGERRHLLSHGLQGGGYAYVDLETWIAGEDESLRTAAAADGTAVIRSLHDFEGIPEGLAGFLGGDGVAAGEIPKAAVTPNGSADLVRFVEAVTAARAAGDSHPRIVVAMGSVGFPARVLAGRFGSLLTFCSPISHDEVSAAPGHIDPATMHDLYRYPEITEHTAVFGVVGNPVMHSRSPAYHNERFASDGLDAVYLPFEVDDPAAFVRLGELLPIQGFSVTIPHKQAVIPFLREVDESVSDAGACNTVVRDGLGWVGFNSDVTGFLEPLRDAVAAAGTVAGATPAGATPTGAAGLRGMRATVVGAGGAARAVVSALLREGVAVLLLNRTVERAERLRDEIATRLPAAAAVRVAPLDESSASLIAESGDIIVQTTSIGMEPDIDGDAIDFYRFSGSEIVYDIVYTPEETALLRRAAAAGCRTVSGRLMFERQADAQYQRYRQVVLLAR
ncbi:MAG: type I 3-dehydroquinate dehydratase [Spirochaetaceae bacterium]|nr:MAG: type I 3-dehydroquinate dehydratase [Spirochaetaceae bacterium]